MLKKNAYEHAGIIIEYDIDANGNRTQTRRIPAIDPSKAIVQNISAYDQAGRLKSSTDAVGNTTKYEYGLIMEGGTPTGRKKTMIYEDDTQEVRIHYADGYLKEISGNAAYPRKFDYGASPGETWQKEIRPVEENSVWLESEWEIIYQDMLGRRIRREFPDDAEETIHYNSFGELEWTRHPDGVSHYFSYNDLGELQDTAILISGTSGTGIDRGGEDRIRRTERDYLAPGSATNPSSTFAVERVRTWIWPDNGFDTSELLQTVYRTVPGVLDGSATWVDEHGFRTAIETVLTGNGERLVTTIYPNDTCIIETYHKGRLKGRSESRSNHAPLFRTLQIDYDSHGRRWKEVVSPGTNEPTKYLYYDDDSLLSVTTPSPSSTEAVQVTSYLYDERGRVKEETLPDNQSIHYRYFTTGELRKVWGARTYPVEYGYDAQGRLTKMTTWQDFGQLQGSAETKWVYDSSRGFLKEKLYSGQNAGEGIRYDYTDAARLKKRIWARGVETEYQYNHAGDLWKVLYDDKVTGVSTPDVTYSYDRLGNLKEVQDNFGKREIIYASDGQLEREEFFTGFFVDYSHDSLRRLEQIDLLDPSSALLHRQSYGYDIWTGRLNSAQRQGDLGTSLGYENRHGKISFRYSGGYNAIWSYDEIGRLRSHNFYGDAGWDVLSGEGRGYSYNAANQRTKTKVVKMNGFFPDLNDHGEFYWYYEYDALGQLTEGSWMWHEYIFPPHPVPGLHFEYTFDDIGNRTATVTNGRTTTYTVDPSGLNQYTEREVPSAVDVLLIADTYSDILVNGINPRAQYATYRYHELTDLNSVFDNSNGDKFREITVEEWRNGVKVDEVSGYSYLGNFKETFMYDEDGNLLSDGCWQYIWDAENRLVEIEEVRTDMSAVNTLGKVEYQYDHMGRRLVRTEHEKISGGAWNQVDSTRYFYSGWNVIAEMDANDGLPRTYLWGPDASGTFEGAGGVGGLLSVTRTVGGNSATYFTVYDGNWNVTALIDAGTMEAAAQYEYDAFGNIVIALGDMDICPFRFSTKYEDSLTGLYYYGHRHYNPSTGRWLSRDPIEEQGGLNLYGMVGNDPVNWWDFLGLTGVGCDDLSSQMDIARSVIDGALNRMVQVCGDGDPIDSGLISRLVDLNSRVSLGAGAVGVADAVHRNLPTPIGPPGSMIVGRARGSILTPNARGVVRNVGRVTGVVGGVASGASAVSSFSQGDTVSGVQYTANTILTGIAIAAPPTAVPVFIGTSLVNAGEATGNYFVNRTDRRRQSEQCQRDQDLLDKALQRMDVLSNQDCCQ